MPWKRIGPFLFAVAVLWIFAGSPTSLLAQSSSWLLHGRFQLNYIQPPSDWGCMNVPTSALFEIQVLHDPLRPNETWQQTFTRIRNDVINDHSVFSNHFSDITGTIQFTGGCNSYVNLNTGSINSFYLEFRSNNTWKAEVCFDAADSRSNFHDCATFVNMAVDSVALNGPQLAASEAASEGFLCLSSTPDMACVTTLPVYGPGGIPIPGLIKTAAGNGQAGSGGDGGLAATAQLNHPDAVVVDARGNAYIADTGNHRVRKFIASTGLIFTIAGSVAGYNGDNVQAAVAQLNTPSAVALDPFGNLYIAEYQGERIRKISASTGVITTIAGNGQFGYTGDNGPATMATMWHPVGVAVDSQGNVYIADFNNKAIRKVTATTGIISTLAKISASGTLVLDAAGRYLYVPTAHQINRVDTATGAVTLVAGSSRNIPLYGGDGQSATSDQTYLNGPGGMAIDAAGNLYIADTQNNRIREVDAASGVIRTIVGTGVAGSNGDGGPPIAAQVNNPIGIALDGEGDLYIADTFNHRLRVISQPLGNLISSQTITFPAIGDQVVSTQLQINATASSGLTVTLTSNTPASCTVSGNTVTLNSVSACSITATQPGNEIYSAALPVTQVFNIIRPVTAAISSPAPNTALGGASVTFTWTAVSGADQYWLDVGNSVAQGDISAGALTGITKTVGRLPCDGRTIFVQLWTHMNGAWQTPQRYTYTACTTAPGLTPATGSTLAGTTVTFSWPAVAGADQYWLDVGNSVAQGDISAGALTGISKKVGGLPCDGRTIYVQLWNHQNGAWQTPQRYTYTACTTPGLTPAAGSTLAGTTVTFAWPAVAGADQYWLDVGNSVAQGDISAGALTGISKTVGGLPCDGRTIYVQLWNHQNGAWQTPQRYTYTACTAPGLTPATGSTLAGTTVTFSWPAVAGSDQYWLDVGNSLAQGDISAGTTTATSKSVSGLPCDGRTLYVQLWTHINGTWRSPQRYTYTACNTAAGVGQMLSPAPGGTLPGTSVTFTWSAGTGAAAYWLDVGTVPAQGNLFGANVGTTLSRTVAGIPADGSTIYVQLWSQIGGQWYRNQYVYTAAH